MTRTIRILLIALFAETITVGVWNALFPASFYRNVPTVDLTPPFSEHFARDFGTAFIGIAIVLAAAAWRPESILVIPAAAAYGAFAVPHVVFHASHLDHASPGEAWLLNLVNAAVAVIALLVIVLAVLRGRRWKSR